MAKNVKCSNIFCLSFLSLFSHGFVGHFLLKAYMLLGSGKEKEGGLVLRSCFILFGLRLFYSVFRHIILHTIFVKQNVLNMLLCKRIWFGSKKVRNKINTNRITLSHFSNVLRLIFYDHKHTLENPLNWCRHYTTHLFDLFKRWQMLIKGILSGYSTVPCRN